MKQTWTIKVNGNDYLFINESISTRSGFAHVTELKENGICISKARCNYLNRTWECYRFQSSMKNAVWKLIENKEQYITEQMKAANGWQKVTTARREQIKNAVENDETMKEYRTVLNQL